MEYIEKIKSGRTGAEINNLVRNQRLEMRVSPEEYLKIEKFAISNGYNTLALYVRETALEGPPLQGTKKLKALEYKKTILNLSRIGSNINQGVKALNQFFVENKNPEQQAIIAKLNEIDFLEMKEELKLIRQSLIKKSKWNYSSQSFFHGTC